MRIRRQAPTADAAVSDVVATVLLVGFSVLLFAVVASNILSMPAPLRPVDTDLRLASNATGVLLLSHLGGERIPFSSMVVRLNSDDCPYVTGADEPDGTREDGNATFDPGERLRLDDAGGVCTTATEGVLTVVGRGRDVAAVLLQLRLPGGG